MNPATRAVHAPAVDATIRFTEVDGIRGLACAMIVVFHLHTRQMFWSSVLMDLFFVMSSFLVTRIVLRQVLDAKGLLKFWKRRIERIWPLYMLAVWALMLLSLTPPQGKVYEIEQFWRFFTFSQYSELQYGDDLMYPAIQFTNHLWSVGVEEQFYILLPLLVLGLRYLPGVIGLVVLASVIVSGIYLRATNPHIVLLSNHLDAFALGSLLCLGLRHMEEAPRKQINWLLGGLFLAGLAGFLPFVVEGYRTLSAGLRASEYEPAAATAGVFMMMALMSILAINRGTPYLAPLRWRPLVYLGAISYPLYLVHFPIISLLPKRTLRLMADHGVASPPWWLMTTFWFAVCVLAAHVLYKLIDQQLQGGRRA